MKSFSLVLAIATLLSGAAAGQLSGNYTINASLPTGAGNYASFAAAATDLDTLGVSGPVLFTVVSNAVPYAGFTMAAPIVGASATNTVTFLGAPGVFLSGVAAGFTQVVRLGPDTVSTTLFSGPSFVVIDGFDITVPATGAGVIVTGSTSCVVRNCYVHGSNTGAGIAIVNSNNCVVENNEVANTAATPGTPGNSIYCGGISIYYTSNGTVITRNRVHNCLNQGIFAGSITSSTAPANVVVTNNFVWACVGTGAYPGGIAIRRLSGTSIIANNSVWMTTGALAGIHQTGTAADPQPVAIANNIVKHGGTGACFKFEATAIVPSTVFDYNLYNPGPMAFVGAVAATNYSTLAAWQAVAAPSLAGKEINTAIADPLFTSSTNLHITPSSPAFNSGLTIASVSQDIDGQFRPLNGVYDRGADETPGIGLFAAFLAAPTSGAAPLTVNFTDSSWSSAPGGVTSWAWDFENDGINDSSAQNPSHVYVCPGAYSVKLTVNDATHPQSMIVHSGLITVAAQPFVMSTTGGGIGDLSISPIPTTCYPTTAQGWTLASTSPLNPVGAGPLGGLYPDATTINFVQTPSGPGNPIHFIPAPGLYPNVPLSAPPGSFSSLSGITIDVIEVLVGPSFNVLRVSNVVRLTF